MTSTFTITVVSLLIVVGIVGSTFMYSLSQINPSVIFSFDAQLGRIDEGRSIYEGQARPSSGIMNETFIVRMTNFKPETINNIQIAIIEEPKNEWYAFQEAYLGFGDYEFTATGNKAVIKALPAGMTSSVRFTVRFNTTAIDVNNALSDRSIVTFEITYEGVNRPLTKSITVRFPPWQQ
ncbi:MAG: hypothetical protein FJ358_03900 [Thaumarchaeota archaeon]|nr:hypothetical protein [Nitrososphaerota archaeon]